MSKWSGSRFALAAMAGAALLLAACGSGAQARPQPPLEPLPPQPARPADPSAPALADHGLDLAAFAADIAAAWRADPDPIAVLPAFSDDPLHPRGTQVFASGAGDWLAARVLDALRAAGPGAEVWPPETVVAELARSNRSLADVRTTQDAIPLLAQTDAGFLVYGNVDKETVGGRLSGQARVRVRLLCVQLASGQVVTSCERAITSADAVRDLGARAERGSAVLIGARAPGFTPSLDAEVARTTERALARLLGGHRGVFAGRRCAVVVEQPAAAAGQRLAVTVRTTLLAGLPRALPGRDAIAVVDAASGSAEVVLTASLARGADRYALVLAALPAGAPAAIHVTMPIDPRFDAELRRALS